MNYKREEEKKPTEKEFSNSILQLFRFICIVRNKNDYKLNTKSE